MDLRSTFVAAAWAVAAAAVAPAQAPRATLVTSLPFRPTAIATAPGVAHQFYVAAKNGRIWVVRGNGYLSTPALDLAWNTNQDGEGGLLGMAFHPDFAQNRKVYLCYTRAGGNGDTVVSEFRMAQGTLDQIDVNTERLLVGPIPQTTLGHKAGDLEFGPDGLLYIALGDGDAGSATGSPVAQDLSSPLGKVLRIDVDAPAPHVPPTNPFVGTPGADERVYVYGVRNPWRIDIDPNTGALFIGDVGSTLWEELTRVDPGLAGANLGWPCREGNECRQHSACLCPSSTLLDPFLALQNGNGTGQCAVIGGLVLRGSNLPRLEGQYVFADFCRGSLWMVEDPYGAATLVDLYAELAPTEQAGLRFVSELAQGPDGALLIGTHYSNQVWRIDPRPGFELYCTATPNSTGGPAILTAAGSASIAAADLRFAVTGLPPGALGLPIVGDRRDDKPQVGGTEAHLCVGGSPVFRWGVHAQNATPTGAATFSSNLLDLPFGGPPVAGQTWYFQYWTRDQNPTPTANLSTAVAVTFSP